MKSHFGISTSRMRRAFTLVELLVAMALILFIMSIVSVVFGDATESFRIFRARAELSEKLRFITQTLRADLRANHFENGRRLSDTTFWTQGGPPKAGYLRIEQASPGTSTSTMESDFILTAKPDPTNAVNDNKHVLMLTSFMDPTDFKGFHSISDPSMDPTGLFKSWLNSNNFSSDSRLEIGKSYNSPNAEIAWFIGGVNPATMAAVTQYDFAKNSFAFDRLDASDLGVSLFKLYRRVVPMLPSDPSTATDTTFNPSTLNRISVVPTNVSPSSNKRRFNGITSQLDPNVDVPNRRFFGKYMGSNAISDWRTPSFKTLLSNATDTAGAAVDYAVIADNVLSFSIEVWPEDGNSFTNLQTAFGQKVFDTWSGRSADANWGVTTDFASLTGNNKPKWRDSTDPASVPMTLYKNNYPKCLLAVRITIRLYDLNTKSTWQATVIEYL